MYKAIIIDDEFLAQEGLKKLIELTVPNFFSHIYVASSLNEGVELIRNFKPDIVFLDIHMPNEYGFKIFDYFDQIDFEIVFTTAHSNYIMEAVNQWGCLGYLMKPVSITDLKTILDRFERKIITSNLKDLEPSIDDFEDETDSSNIKLSLNQENGILLFSSVNEINFIKIDEIIFCKASDNYCDIFTINKTYTISKPLKEIEKLIDRKVFVRTHRSYLVNLAYAAKLERKNNVLIMKRDSSDEEEILVPVTASGLKILTNVVS